jgi:glutathione S-transferase
MLTIYGVYRSRATRPLWTALECGCAFTHTPVVQIYRAAAAPGVMTTTDPAFLAINPLAQIPVLTDGDLVLTESLAIAQYIAHRYGGALGPKSDAEYAQTNQWALFAATAVEAPALEIQYTLQDAAKSASREGQATVQVAAEKLRRPLARLQAHLAAHPWLMGDRFTVADICVAECLRYAQGHPTLLSEYPAVKDWLTRCQSRPAFKKMWEARLAEPA